MSDPTDSGNEAANADGAPVPSSLDKLVDEHEEEVSENGEKVRRRGVYLLPNLFTTGALFAGFYAVIAAMRGDFENGAIAIFFAMVFDGLDGRVARLTNTSSKFGEEYDSLSDMVSFGVAPALLVFQWALDGLGKFGWSVAFIYVACAALRLARFNAQIETTDKNFFTGLASPSAAGLMASVVWVCYDFGLVGPALPVEISVLVGLLMALAGLLMIANFPYHSFKGFDGRGRVPFAVVIGVVFLFSLVTLDPPKVFLFCFATYAASGPVLMLFRARGEKAIDTAG